MRLNSSVFFTSYSSAMIAPVSRSFAGRRIDSNVAVAEHAS